MPARELQSRSRHGYSDQTLGLGISGSIKTIRPRNCSFREAKLKREAARTTIHAGASGMTLVCMQAPQHFNQA